MGHRSLRTMSPVRRLAHRLGAPLAITALKALWSTYRWTIDGDAPVRAFGAEKRPMILTLWHGDIAVGSRFLSTLGRAGVNVTYLVSPSVDGEFAVRLLALIDGRSVRGSATRSGVKAMHGLYRAMVKDNGSPVVLPDGPLGPRRECKPGSLLLARLSGAPIVPIACAASSSWRLRTWDRQLIPRPFSRVVIAVGKPFTIPADGDEETLQRNSVDLGRRMIDLETRAQAIADGPAV